MANNPLLSEQAVQLATSYHDYLTARGDIASSTIHHYLGDVTAFADWYETAYSPNKALNAANVDAETLNRYRVFLETKAGLKATSINRHFASLRSFFEWALHEKLTSENPTQEIQRASERQVTRVLSEAEETAFVQTIEQADFPSERWNKNRDRAIIYLMLYAGLRVDEVQFLRREQVEFNAQRGSLRQIGKPGQQRNVPLNAIAHAALKQHLDQLPKQSEYVFPSDRARRNTEEPITGRTIHNLVTRYTSLAGIGDLKPYDLRHTFCYRLAKADVPVERIAQLVGSAVKRTKRYRAIAASRLSSTTTHE